MAGARIWPLQVMVVLILVAVGLITLASGNRSKFLSSSTYAPDIAVNILMLQGFGVGENLNGPSGTVSQELGAYALFPLFLIIVMNRRRSIAAVGIGLSIP